MLNKDKQEKRQEITKKQEYKRIGSTPKKKGASLFAKDSDTGEVYKVPIHNRKVLDLTKKEGTHKSVVNPSHKTLWAVNMTNALRKFNR